MNAMTVQIEYMETKRALVMQSSAGAALSI
jgi:hypothetical protein